MNFSDCKLQSQMLKSIDYPSPENIKFLSNLHFILYKENCTTYPLTCVYISKNSQAHKKYQT